MALKAAYFGLQCFWGESAWAKLKGVDITRVGYAGGQQPNPTYKAILDHTEITEVQYNDQIISYEKLLDFFWKHHDPTEKRKKQYRSAILYVDDQQKELALKSFEEAKKKFGEIETYVEPLDKFYQAEDYHQKYWFRNRKDLFDELKLDNEAVATGKLATKLNAYAAGYQRFEELDELQKQYKLSDDYVKRVKDFALSGGDPRACH
ncbi:unnamed protein product [Caenorhabditis bovis]|uniref:peptide-methionine (S)-S-oxide reductase n=1 Tax=Caenorhabditis bovis TaxID=2654633 RepID=A0A8S1EVT5_9PELO|nr:unnamed protein product [Caenorhabditis bovis]